MTDTAEYWNDVKRSSFTPSYTHLNGLVCGHFHKYDTDKLANVNCKGCLDIIFKDESLKLKYTTAVELQDKKRELSRRKKKGHKLSSIIKFGKYKGHQKTLQWVIDNDKSYFRWMQGKVLFHPEVDIIITSINQ